VRPIIREGRLAAVEKIADLRGRSYHHVAIEFDSPVDGQEFSGIPGVSQLQVDGSRVSFKVSGALDPVVKAAARHVVLDMELTDLDVALRTITDRCDGDALQSWVTTPARTPRPAPRGRSVCRASTNSGQVACPAS
jgi:hypothetical protein